MPVRKTLCGLSEIPDGGAIERVAAIFDRDGAHMIDESLVLTRHGTEVSAYVNVCPHAGRRLDWAPGQFLIEEGLLICAAHGAGFTLATGECVYGPCRGESLMRVDVALDGADVQLRD
ncbi:MAG: Rieske 2Fe-2S domain-containing protein [Gammaproteobacteria bacterium]|nr:MAG: Rieske 2Fe-2S domain-containing protein [Gammaproteobacteria bacterium]